MRLQNTHTHTHTYACTHTHIHTHTHTYTLYGITKSRTKHRPDGFFPVGGSGAALAGG